MFGFFIVFIGLGFGGIIISVGFGFVGSGFGFGGFVIIIFVIGFG